MRTTSGRCPSASIDASRSSAWPPPPASPTTSMSGSLSRNTSNPRRTTSWSSTTRTAMDSSRVASISGLVRFRRDPDAYACSRSGCARDGKSPTDLRRTAAHRFQAEVTGMSAVRVEAAPVVTYLNDDLIPLSLDLDARHRRLGVPHDIRERLPADGEQLRFHLLGHGQPRRGSSDVDDQTVRSAQAGGVSRECANQAVVDRFPAQLEDQRADLALHAPREVRDRGE